MNTTDWQTWAAIAIVLITTLVFARRAMRKKSGGCGSCGCGASTAKKTLASKTGVS